MQIIHWLKSAKYIKKKKKELHDMQKERYRENNHRDSNPSTKQHSKINVGTGDYDFNCFLTFRM